MTGGLPKGPFVLADAADGSIRLFSGAVDILQTSHPAEVRRVLEQVRAAVRRGLHVAGYLSYEAGFALQPRVIDHPSAPLPLVWFGVFDVPRLLSSDEAAALLPHAGGATIGAVRSHATEAEYAAMFARIQQLIAAGDIYQANLTIRASVPLSGDPAAAFAAVRSRARAPHAALVQTGADWLLSFSPESFFDLRAGQVTARPMKGTASRAPTPEADRRQIDQLRTDIKQRAENLMIVDLMRNDLSKIAQPGTVRVPGLFEVETYPTVHQMTSSVTADIRADVDAVDILLAAFPAGSITGAPKLRAMEVIAEVERQPRGIYCGSIGWIGPDGSASFNVAIRTIHLSGTGTVGTLGLGSGIVSDSELHSEWSECLTKSLFLRL